MEFNYSQKWCSNAYRSRMMWALQCAAFMSTHSGRGYAYIGQVGWRDFELAMKWLERIECDEYGQLNDLYPDCDNNSFGLYN